MANKRSQLGSIEAVIVFFILLNGGTLFVGDLIASFSWGHFSSSQVIAVLFALAVNIMLLRSPEITNALRGNRGTFHLTFAVGARAKERIDKLKEQSRLELSQVLGRAFALYDLAIAANLDGGKLLIDRWGTVKEINLDLPADDSPDWDWYHESEKVDQADNPRFHKWDLVFIPLSQCTPKQLAQVCLYVIRQYPRDNKPHPENSLEWLFFHGLPHLRTKEYDYKEPHQIYVAFDTEGRVLDIAGVVPDDRGVARQLGLFESDPHYLAFFGGHRVHPDRRGCGIGTLMVRHRLERIQAFVNDVSHTPASVYAFLVNPASGRLLEKVGFENRGLQYIEDSGGEEYVYRRQINPGETI